MRVAEFDEQTHQIIVLDTTKKGKKFILRYGDIGELAPKSIIVEIKDKIQQGQSLGKIGSLLKDIGVPTVRYGKEAEHIGLNGIPEYMNII